MFTPPRGPGDTHQALGGLEDTVPRTGPTYIVGKIWASDSRYPLEAEFNSPSETPVCPGVQPHWNQ